jgi:hypothetical protein
LRTFLDLAHAKNCWLEDVEAHSGEVITWIAYDAILHEERLQKETKGQSQDDIFNTIMSVQKGGG